MKHQKLAIALLGTLLVLSGCMTGPDMDPVWESDVQVEELGSVYIMDDGNRVILGTEKDVHLLDGTDGSTVVALEESFWDLSLRNIQVDTAVGSFFSSDVIAGKYDIAPLHRSGVVLLFDFRFNTEIVTAVDAETGQELWQSLSMPLPCPPASGLPLRSGRHSLRSPVRRYDMFLFQRTASSI